MPFQLSAQLSVHQQDVRGVASPRDNLILSSSRDGSAIIWHRDAPTIFNPVAALTPSDARTKFVNAVAYLPSTTPDGPPEGYVVTGHQDGVVRVWAIDPSVTEPLHVLKGHTADVCTLHTLPDGTIISGSWDNTAKVWQGFSLAYDLKGHEASVWAVLALGEGQFLTGSADKRIKFWREDRCTRTYTGHNGPVRGLALFSDIGFASCSNDQNILLWTHEGDIISTLSGHTSFVYSIAMLPSGDIVSAGEDSTVRVWRDGELFQTIMHPCPSVWAVAAMPSGDIVSGSSDGVVRIWSEASERVASAEDIKALDAAIAEASKPQPDPNDPLKDVETFPAEALSTPGTEPDESKIIIEQDGSAWAYSWNASSFQWKKLGPVRAPPGKKLFAGKYYDYVWEVDIADGQPKAELPYNNGENPYTVAQRFLERNSLPMVYLDQVVNYISQMIGPAAAAAASSGGSEYQDPFTGAGSYRPAASRPAANTSSYQDPFTGAGAYRPAPAAAQGGGNYSDPFTGSGAYRPAAASPPPQVAQSDPYTGASRYTSSAPTSNPSSPPPVPATANVTLPYFTTSVYHSHTNPQGLYKRLQENNARLKDEPSTSTLAMYPDEATHIEQLVQHFTGRNGQPSISSQHLETVLELLNRWPPDAALPVADLARLVAGADPTIAAAQAPALMAALSTVSSLPQVNPQRATTAVLALRTFANIAPAATPAQPWVLPLLQLLLQIPYAQLNAQQRIALASVLSNLSVAAQKGSFGADVLGAHAALAGRILEQETTDTEVQYRIVMALGNMLHASRARSTALPNAAALRTLVSAAVNRIATARPERRAVCESVTKLVGSA